MNIAQQEAKIAEQLANKAIEEKRGVTESRKLEVAAEAYRQEVEGLAKAEAIKAEALANIELAKANKALSESLREAGQGMIEYKHLDIEMKQAEASLEFAKHYTGQVPTNVTIIGDEAARNNRMLLGLPNPGILMDE